VLLVPNAALRYIPAPQAGGSTPSGGLLGALLPRHPASMQRPGSGNAGNGTERVWVLQDRQLRAVPVRVGASDGSFTEVGGDELREGMAVIVERMEKRA
jgi:HlyD family secretion protein